MPIILGTIVAGAPGLYPGALPDGTWVVYYGDDILFFPEKPWFLCMEEIVTEMEWARISETSSTSSSIDGVE
jgi:hypothetical protein